MRGEKPENLHDKPLQKGSPPRARGKVQQSGGSGVRPGITPACAGKSGACASPPRSPGDHPRVRGEKVDKFSIKAPEPGSPPRARGKGMPRTAGRAGVGITPACAGKSDREFFSGLRLGDHPRVRGEKWESVSMMSSPTGSPPRARGKEFPASVAGRHPGITPACAGKSDGAPSGRDCGRDHPRVRGEKVAGGRRGLFERGSPPRARGKELRPVHAPSRFGITPACAGKRRLFATKKELSGDHPRVRGEKVDEVLINESLLGSPPRARGKAGSRTGGGKAAGITPACAGKRRRHPCRPWTRRDHPRVRGEKVKQRVDFLAAVGSPPRARGKEKQNWSGILHSRITPACAGKSFKGICVNWSHWDHPRVRGEKLAERAQMAASLGSPPRARGKVSIFTYQWPLPGITPACAGKRFPEIHNRSNQRDHPRVRGEKYRGQGSAQSG